jgi:hypothetical protein
VIAVELGAEEDDVTRQKWTTQTIGGLLYPTQTGGEQYAAYYLAAWDKVKNNANHPEWKNLTIVAGGSSVFWYEFVYLVEDKPSKQFLKGFFNVVSQTANLHKVPDVIGVHPYTKHRAPEGDIIYDGYVCEVHKVNNVIYDMCKNLEVNNESHGFVPDFAATEYGFSPTFPVTGTWNPYAPTNEADNYTQAIYYLRSRLIHACSSPGRGIGMNSSHYFYHPRSLADCVVSGTKIDDLGFHNFDAYPGGRRAVRDIAEELCDPQTGILLGGENTKVWLPIETDDYDENTKYAICGFKQDSSVLWLVVWRFTLGEDFFKEANGESVSFSINGNYSSDSYNAYSRHFTISQQTGNPATLPFWNGSQYFYLPNQTGSAAFGAFNLSTFTRSYSNGETTFTISPVNENPVFIRLEACG